MHQVYSVCLSNCCGCLDLPNVSSKKNNFFFTCNINITKTNQVWFDENHRTHEYLWKQLKIIYNIKIFSSYEQLFLSEHSCEILAGASGGLWSWLDTFWARTALLRYGQMTVRVIPRQIAHALFKVCLGLFRTSYILRACFIRASPSGWYSSRTQLLFFVKTKHFFQELFQERIHQPRVTNPHSSRLFASLLIYIKSNVVQRYRIDFYFTSPIALRPVPINLSRSLCIKSITWAMENAFI